MTVPAVTFLAVDLVATMAVFACVAALVRQVRRLASAGRRLADDAGPTVRAIADLTERIGSR